MRPELEALQRACQQSQVAESFVKLALLEMDSEVETALADSIVESLNRFIACPHVSEKIKNINDLGKRIGIISDISPSFLLAITHVLKGKPKEAKRLLKLMVAAMDFLAINSISSQESKGVLLSCVDRADDLPTLQSKAADTSDATYLPAIIKHEVGLVAEVINEFPDIEGRSERIEMLYFYRAACAIYYRVYFNFLQNSPSDAASIHINSLFSPVFLALRKFEIRFFLKSRVPLRKVEYVIEKDDPKYRHSILRNHIFTLLGNYGPLINDGGRSNLNVTGQSALRSQLKGLTQMKPAAIESLLLSLKKYRGLAVFGSLVTSLQRAGNNRLPEIQNYLNQSDSEESFELLELINSHLQKTTGRVPKPLVKKQSNTLASLESIRLAEAKRKLKANQGRKMMTQHEVEDYLKSRLKRFMDQVVKEGALTHDKIPEYLARFASASSDMMHDRKPTTQEITSFQESTKEIIDDIAEEANVDLEVVAEERAEIEAHTEKLKEAVTIEEKSEIMNDIGLKINDVQKKIDWEMKMKELLAKEIIPIGLEDNAPLIELGGFMSFPLVESGKKPEDQDEWFYIHLKYIDILLREEKFSQDDFNFIMDHLEHFKRIKYKKYFDIFPNDSYEDTTMMAVYSLWENKALAMLRISD